MAVWTGSSGGGGGGGGNVFVTEQTTAPGPTDDGFPNGTIWIDTVACKSYLLKDNTPGSAVWTQIGGPAWIEDKFIATAAQVTFILSSTPTDLRSLTLSVNGVSYGEGLGNDYTVSGTTVTWLNTLFLMSAGDRVAVQYR